MSDTRISVSSVSRVLVSCDFASNHVIWHSKSNVPFPFLCGAFPRASGQLHSSTPLHASTIDPGAQDPLRLVQSELSSTSSTSSSKFHEKKYYVIFSIDMGQRQRRTLFSNALYIMGYNTPTIMRIALISFPTFSNIWISDAWNYIRERPSGLDLTSFNNPPN